MVKQKIEAILSEFSKAIPEDMQYLKQDMEKNLRATLNATFTKMDLVTREEFDVQASLLQRTRAQLEALQTKLKEIENQIKETSD